MPLRQRPIATAEFEVRAVSTRKAYCYFGIDEDPELRQTIAPWARPNGRLAQLRGAFDSGAASRRQRSAHEKRWDNARTGSIREVLRASHIRPRAGSSHEDFLNPENGHLLLANLDILFKFVSFDDNGRMLVSTELSASDSRLLGLGAALKARRRRAAQPRSAQPIVRVPEVTIIPDIVPDILRAKKMLLLLSVSRPLVRLQSAGSNRTNGWRCYHEARPANGIVWNPQMLRILE